MDARLILAGLLFWCGQVFAQGFDHSAWNGLLNKHVVVLDGGKASQLRYAGMARDRAALKGYLERLSQTSEAGFKEWTKEEQMAFLINAYNAFTVEKILTRYPDIKSVWDFGKLFGNPFRDEFFSLLGRKASLDWIEHENLRKNYRDARIHYALNCASIGCPMLREEAYAGARLERQLDEQAARFLSDRSRNRVRSGVTGGVAGSRLEVSKIFDWYKEDFEPRSAYFARHAGLLSGSADEKKLLADGKMPFVFLEYDWNLNDAFR